MMAVGSLLLLLLLVCLRVESIPTRCEEMEVERICLSLISADNALLPGLVRLAFHDCVGTNGCDGCIDIENPDNAGLKRYIDALEAVYDDQNIRKFMSRADFWILCSFVAIREGHYISGANSTSRPDLVMKYGREDCHTETPYQRSSTQYPSPHGTYNQTTEYFKQEFNLSANQTLALLGAHTLGRARRHNSGFINQWVSGEFSFDNEFYKDMLDERISWVQAKDSQNTENPHWQWVHNSDKDFLMFTSDMICVRDIQPGADGKVNESFTDIPTSEGYQLSRLYAEHNEVWLADFTVAYTKMIEKLSPDLDVILEPAVHDIRFTECDFETVTQNRAASTTSTYKIYFSLFTIYTFLLLTV